ncbi:hypothetical protein D9757_001829 [Collybiopsis confluens]|uniref:JmjC domain-containing protein n=1 Tax=Collybiopsis confluens TaxID=2823264 RepID=A0A8H5HYJ7_9AGAR|nr:hypothetical protein D9757_001829 [Collybiopsis confluens]
MSWQAEYLDILKNDFLDRSCLNTIRRFQSSYELRIHCETELLGCGLKTFSSLLETLECPVVHVLDDLLSSAYQKMSSQGTAESCWPRLYTDASIIRSLACLDASTAQAAIATLDRAIIVAGAIGVGRLDLTLSLIRRTQVEFLTISPFKPMATLPSLSPISIHLPTSCHNIPIIDPAPSFTSFQQNAYRLPFMLRQYARSWPALNAHSWASAAYLRSVAGPARIVPVEVGADYRAHDWTQQLIKWDEFLAFLDLNDQLHTTPPPNNNKVLYLAQHNLLIQFPDLSRDIIIPDYVYSCPPPLEDFPQYRPPGNDEQLVINAWLGPQGTISPAHTDPYYNLYVQVVGRKTVWLAPPSISAYMYTFGPQTVQDANPASNKTEPSMSNTSQLDVFTLSPDDTHTYPQFWEHVFPQAMSTTLGAGDALFIPPGWWHAMRAEDTSFSVSMWF